MLVSSQGLLLVFHQRPCTLYLQDTSGAGMYPHAQEALRRSPQGMHHNGGSHGVGNTQFLPPPLSAQFLEKNQEKQVTLGDGGCWVLASFFLPLSF